ncbi:YceI family protein [Izhakiella capsodis]|nr:YceI family protein [Izhakiella capsodis]
MGLGIYSQVAGATGVSYKIDASHTSVIVSWAHFGFSHPTASISEASGNIVFDKTDPSQSKVDVTLPLNTIDTRVPALTEAFLGAGYFDVKNYPTATFSSSKVTATGNNKFDVAGNLTIKGITKPVVLHATLNQQEMHPMVKKPAIGFDATATVKRSDYKLDEYVPSVSDEIAIRISTEAYAK